LPDLSGRRSILDVYARDKPLAANVDLDDLARQTIGMSGADLQNVLNESAIFSARHKKTEIDAMDVAQALDRILIGLEKHGSLFSPERQRLVAYHEAGHALLGAVM
jgi:cell division protease FtsH